MVALRTLSLALVGTLALVPSAQADNEVNENCLVPGEPLDGGVCRSSATTPDGDGYNQCYYARPPNGAAPVLLCQYPGHPLHSNTCVWTENNEVACDQGLAAVAVEAVLEVAGLVTGVVCDRVSQPC